MKHFTMEDWCDFVRGLVSPERAALMQHHLGDGCKRCSTFCRTLRAISDIARTEAGFQPPEKTVRLAKSAYAETKWRLLASNARVARLITDSFLQPAPAGLRSATQPARQLLVKSGQFLIDMRLEPGQKRVFLAGQVVNSKKSGKRVQTAEVALLSEDRLVAQTAANAFGEFQLEFATEHRLRLVLGVPGHVPIEISLPDGEV